LIADRQRLTKLAVISLWRKSSVPIYCSLSNDAGQRNADFPQIFLWVLERWGFRVHRTEVAALDLGLRIMLSVDV
jgi:hypothetical protein